MFYPFAALAGTVPRRKTRGAGTYMTVLLFGCFLCGMSCSQRPSDRAVGYRSDPDARNKETLLLRDFQPRSMLHAAEHLPQRAKFPAIDVHNHVDDAMGIGAQDVPVDQLIATMDSVHVQRVVILTGMWGERFEKVYDALVRTHPDRFLLFSQIDWSKIDDADFSSRMIRQLDDAVSRGARGLKVLKDLGLEVRDKSGRLVTVDDPRLDPIWEECGQLGIPVAIHTSDPEAFFLPLDAQNERYEELIENPTWSFSGSQYPRKSSLLEARNRIIAKHPRTTFIALHVANWPENLDAVSEWLRQYPNMFVELGAREAELGRQPGRARSFFLEFQDRILFGTDADPDPAMYRNWFRWLETGDEYFDYWGYPGQGRWKIYGLALPDTVLQKVYYKNAERIFAQFQPAAIAK
jgi:predicted TIM-barrel fold metal-dependent hydrolase